MSYDQFWLGDPWLVQDYYKADKIKKEFKNQEMWMQGLYYHEALSVVLHNAFKKQSESAASYPKEPFALTNEEVERRAERDNKIALSTAKAQFEALAESLRLEKEV